MSLQSCTDKHANCPSTAVEQAVVAHNDTDVASARDASTNIPTVVMSPPAAAVTGGTVDHTFLTLGSLGAWLSSPGSLNVEGMLLTLLLLSTHDATTATLPPLR